MTEVDDRILATALEILRQRGPSAVSIESVTAQSGIAKTTIYRRYDNRTELLQAAVRSASKAVDLPPDLSSADTIRWVLRHTAGTIEKVVGRGTVAAMIMDEDPEFSLILLGMIRVTTRPLREELKRLRDTGELRADLDVELAMSALLGVAVVEVIRRHPTDEAWVESVFALLWPALRT